MALNRVVENTNTLQITGGTIGKVMYNIRGIHYYFSKKYYALAKA